MKTALTSLKDTCLYAVDQLRVTWCWFACKSSLSSSSCSLPGPLHFSTMAL